MFTHVVPLSRVLARYVLLDGFSRLKHFITEMTSKPFVRMNLFHMIS